MSNVAIKIDIKDFVDQLTEEQYEELEKSIQARNINRISDKMSKSAQKNKLSEKDINKICERARQQVYEKYSN